MSQDQEPVAKKKKGQSSEPVLCEGRSLVRLAWAGAAGGENKMVSLG